MTGKFNHGIDSKGRLTVPAQLRRELGEVCYVVRGADRYLNVYSAAGWEKFCAKFEGQSQSRGGQMRFLFANTATCELDAQGRILIPTELRDYAGIGRNVTMIGLPDRAEIWDSETYAETEARFFETSSMAQLYEELGL